MSTAVATAVATILATLITVLAGYLTKKASTRATVRNAENVSRTDLERDAFVRADAISERTMQRLERESTEKDIRIDRLEETVEKQAMELAALRRELDVAKRALGRRFPDE